LGRELIPIALIFELAVLCLIPGASRPLSLDQELARLRTDTVLVFPATSLDGPPSWSPDGDYLIQRLDEDWFKVDLRHMSLGLSTWRRDHPIGVLQSQSSISHPTPQEVRAWTAGSKSQPRLVRTTSGLTIELRQEDLGTLLVVTPKNGSPDFLWATDMENCHSLALSPDEKHVAFISELSGIVVMSVPPQPSSRVVTREQSDDIHPILFEPRLTPDQRLLRAARRGEVSEIKKQLQQGANPNVKDNITKASALVECVMTNRTEGAKLLIQHGADVNAKNRRGASALMHAAGRGNVQIVKMLLNHHADVSAHTKHGDSALKWARNYPEILRLLKNAGETK
jgi:hypothetical protein